MGLTGTHQNLVGLTIFKSGESRDSPFQNPSENLASGNILLFFTYFRDSNLEVTFFFSLHTLGIPT